MLANLKRSLSSAAYLINRFIFQKQYLFPKTIFGTRFKIVASDAVGRSIYKSGNYEPEITHFVGHDIYFDDNDIVIDIGANIGWYSILLGAAKNKIKTIYAFEPDSENFELLLKNIALNKVTNIQPIKKALSNSQGEASLYKYGSRNLGRHSLLPLFNGETETVETLSLDHFLETNQISQKIKLMKIDVEGFEAQVVKGAQNALMRTENLILELSPSLMRNHGEDPKEIIKALFDLGFEPYHFKLKTVVPINKHEVLECADVNTYLFKKHHLANA